MMNRLCAVGAVLLVSANSALAWNYGEVTCYQPVVDAKGNVSFKRISEMRNGPEGSAVEDLKRWRKESVSLIAGTGSLPATYEMTLTYVKEQPFPTVRVDISNHSPPSPASPLGSTGPGLVTVGAVLTRGRIDSQSMPWKSRRKKSHTILFFRMTRLPPEPNNANRHRTVALSPLLKYSTE